MISRLLSFAAAAGLVAAPIAGQAQQTMGQGNLLGLPSDLSMLQDSDPNHRVATAGWSTTGILTAFGVSSNAAP